jgi:hypothetical protein
MTSFPTSKDSFTNPDPNSDTVTVRHSAQHANINDAMMAVQTKLGVNGDSSTSSMDYKLSGVTGSDKAASLAGSETLSNKTFSAINITNGTTSANGVNFGSDVNLYRSATDVLKTDDFFDANGMTNRGPLNLYNTGAANGVLFGDGAGGYDTNIYRSGANTLKTDDTLIIGAPGTAAGSAVTIDGTQTLTSKTLTTPTIASFTNATHTHQNAAGGGTLDAAAIAAGTIATARLGSGSASSSTYLRGDQTWVAVSGGDSRRTIHFDWSNVALPDSNFPGISKTVGSNWVYKTLDFDQTTSEACYWYFRIPTDFSPTSCVVKVDWTATSGSGTFIPTIVTRSPSNDEVIDATTTPSSASAVNVTSTLTATGDLNQCSITLTTSGWAAGDLIQMKLSRDIADTLNADAKVLCVTAELR